MLKKSFTFITAVLILFSSIRIQAQIVFKKTYYEDVASQDFGFIPTDAFQLQDGSMILAGSEGEVGNGDFFVTRTDKSGTITWSKGYGNFRGQYNAKAVLAYDGNVVVSGTGGGSESYIQVIKVNTLTGAVIWSRTFQTISAGNNNQNGYDMIQSADSGLIICGTTGSTNNSAALFKLDRNGNMLWAKHFIVGSTSTNANRMALLPSGDFIVVGKVGATMASSTPIAARFDNSGNLIWSRNITVNGAYTGNNFHNVSVLSDGNFIVSVENSTNAYGALAKINSTTGAVIWGNQYYHSSCTGCSRVNVMREVTGGQILVGGYYSGSTQDYMVKIDGSTGAYLTGRLLSTSCPYGPVPQFSINKTLDGSNLWWSYHTLYKFRDNLTFCSGSAVTLTVAAATTASNATTFTFNTYLNEVTVAKEGAMFVTNLKTQVQSDCGGKCTTLDNLGSSFRMASYNNVICPSQSLTFTNTSIASNSSLWSVDGVPVGTSTNLTYTLASSGIHTVQLIAGSASGCFDTSTSQITVNAGCDPPPGPVGMFSKGFSNFNTGRGLTQTSDGGYAITGGSNAEMGIVKLDATGNQQWAWQYGNLSANELGQVILQTLDGGYLSIGSEGQHLMLVKLNTSGSYLWSYHYRVGSATGSQPNIWEAVELSDGSVIMVGSINISGVSNAFMCRIDNMGNMLWEKHFLDGSTQATLAGITKLTSGNFIVTGNGNGGGFALTIDQNGNLLWSRKIGGQNVTKALEMPNGDFACAIATSSFVGVMKFTPLGQSYVYKIFFNSSPGSFSNIAHRFIRTGVWGYAVVSVYNYATAYTFLLDNEFNTRGTMPFAANSDQTAQPIWTTDNSIVGLQAGNIMKMFPFDPFIYCSGTNGGPSNNAVTAGFTSNPAWTPTLNSFFFDDPQTLFNYAFTLTSSLNCNSTACGVVSGFIGPVTACTGQVLNFANTSFNGVSYNWKENGVSFATTTNSTRTYGSPGTYVIRLVATGSSGCKDSVQISVVVSSGVTANAGSDVSITCGNNTTLSASGGTTYLWTPSTGLSNPSISNPVASPSVTTTYTCTVGNGGACFGTDAVIVTVTGGPTVNVSGPVTICNGGSTTIVASGATTYVWSPAAGLSSTTVSSPLASPTITTTYTVTGTTSGCSGTNTVTVTVDASPTVSASATSNTICSGSSTTLNSSGANTYVWNPGNLPGSSVSVSPTTTTTYTVTGTAANGCTNTNTTTITVDQQPTVSNAGTDQSVCATTATLTGNTATTGSGIWTLISGTATITTATSPTSGLTGLGVGPNTLRWTISNGSCTPSFDDVVITRDVNPTTANAGTDQTICATTATLAGNSPTTGTGSWTLISGTAIITTPTSPTSGLTGIGVGANTLRWTISSGSCTPSFDDVIITRDANPTTANAGADQNVCATTTSLSGNSPTTGTGLWTLISGTATITTATSPTSGLTGLGVGPNTLRWTISNGSCTPSFDDVIITRDANPTTANAGTDQTICSTTATLAGNIATTGSGVWTLVSGTATITTSTSPTSGLTGIGVGANTLRWTISNGSCTPSFDDVVITRNNMGVTTSFIPVTCNGGNTGSATANATGTGPFTYLWSNAQTTATATGLVANTYTVTVTGAGGCTAQTTVIVTQPTLLTVSATQINATCSCNGSITPTAIGGTAGYTYAYSPAGPNNLCAGTYTVTATDANGCTAQTIVTITQPTTLSLNAVTNTNVDCFGNCNGSVNLTPSGGTGPYTFSPSPNNLCAGTYTFTVTDANGCTSTANATISQPTIVSGTVSNTFTSCGTCCDGTANVNATGGTPGYTYVWTPSAQTTPTATGLCVGTYTVCITDANGCTSCSTTNVSFNVGSQQPTTVNEQLFQVYPNPFNESISIKCDNISGQVNVCIYDELGQLLKCVQITNNTTEIDTQDLASGIYMFQIITNDQVITKKLVKTK